MNTIRPYNPNLQPKKRAPQGRNKQRLSPGFTIGFIAAIGFGLIAFTILKLNTPDAPDLVADTSISRYHVGDKSLSIPANMIRFADQRADLSPKRIDLVLSWPDLQGFNESQKDMFQKAASSQVIMVTYAQHDGAEDPVTRVRDIYSKMLDRGVEAPAGLVGYRFKKDMGYDGEELFYEPSLGGLHPYVVRCTIEPVNDANPVCLREIHYSDQMIMVYAFRRNLLGQWGQIEQRLQLFTEGLMRGDLAP